MSTPTSRGMRPRPTVEVETEWVSQLTSLAVCGIDPARWRGFAQREHLAVARVGHLDLVRKSEVHSALARLARQQGTSEQNAVANDTTHDVDDDVPTTVEGVLARLGRRLA